MHTIWQALAWKEWHEHKWKLAAILAILIVCVAMVVNNADPRLFSNLQFAIILPIIPLSVLIATSVATSERSRGTLPFLASLPVSPRKVATAKLLYGLGSCMVPVFLTLSALYAWFLCWGMPNQDYRLSMEAAARSFPEPFDFANWFLAVGCGVMFWVVSLFLWTAATGVNRADEVSAAAVALSAIAMIWLGIVGVGVWLSDDQFERWLHQGGAWLAAVTFGIAPGGFSMMDEVWDLGPLLALAALTLFVLVHSSLAVWFVRRYGRDSDRKIRSHQAASSRRSRRVWLAPPRRSWLSAIVWKQFRESGPVIWAGLGGVAAILGFGLLAWSSTLSNTTELRDVFAAAMFFGCLYLGGLTTLVVGIGVFLRDLSPGLHTFWRSRPISLHAWYWIKYATGLTIIFLAFQLPMLLFPVLASTQLAKDLNGTPEILRIQILGAAAFVAIFSIAVAATCLTRNAVYATVLSILAIYGGVLLLIGAVHGYQLITSDDRAEYLLDEPQGTPLWIATMIGASVFATTLGWLAIRYDWGRKNS